MEVLNKHGSCFPVLKVTLLSSSMRDTLLFLTVQGWSGGAMVLGKLPVLGRPTYLE